MSAPPVRIGTSSWSSEDWKGPFYPRGLRPGDFLAHYATRFDTVECDATFYRIPAPRTVEGWAAKTPEEPDNSEVLITEEPGRFAEQMGRVGHRFGFRLLGGCCGTNPQHMHHVAKVAS